MSLPKYQRLTSNIFLSYRCHSVIHIVVQVWFNYPTRDSKKRHFDISHTCIIHTMYTTFFLHIMVTFKTRSTLLKCIPLFYNDVISTTSPTSVSVQDKVEKEKMGRNKPPTSDSNYRPRWVSPNVWGWETTPIVSTSQPFQTVPQIMSNYTKWGQIYNITFQLILARRADL